MAPVKDGFRYKVREADGVPVGWACDRAVFFRCILDGKEGSPSRSTPSLLQETDPLETQKLCDTVPAGATRGKYLFYLFIFGFDRYVGSLLYAGDAIVYINCSQSVLQSPLPMHPPRGFFRRED